ncbi:hypothetical protein Tco_1440190 [Tanacetum coccineum]
MFDPTNKPSDALPVKIKAPKELPKISLVNESLKKLKFHLAKFDNVVNIKTTPNTRTEGEWGFEHTKALFNNEIIPFLKSLKDIFNVFNRDILNEIMEVKTVFDQIDAAVQQSLVENNVWKFLKKNYFWKMIDSYKKSYFFENNNLKAQLQDKDSTICKLKDIIKSLREKSKDKNIKYDYCEIETKNVELENSVATLLSENEHLCNEINHVKQVFKEKFDSIKKTRVHSKEQSDSLIDKLNLKSAENEDLKAQIQDKVFVITSLKNDLRKLKGKEIVDIAAQLPSAITIVPGMFKLDLEPLAPRLLQNSAKKVAVAPKNTIKKVRFAEPLTSSSNVKHVESSKTSDSNIPVLSSTGLKCSTNIPSSSSLVMTGCLDCSLPSELRMFETHDREPLSAHELSYALGKTKKSSHQPKVEDTNQEKLYLLHTDLCGPMRVASINGKRPRGVLGHIDISTSGSAQFLGDKLVSWSSKKKKCTAISSTEAEYIALSGCCAQIL